jgi:hypothetical protein
MARGNGWNALLQQRDPSTLSEHTVVATGTKVIHCWLTTMTSDNVMAVMTLDIIAALDTILVFVIPFE